MIEVGKPYISHARRDVALVKAVAGKEVIYDSYHDFNLFGECRSSVSLFEICYPNKFLTEEEKKQLKKGET